MIDYDFEMEFLGDCTNTFGEDQKHFITENARKIHDLCHEVTCEAESCISSLDGQNGCYGRAYYGVFK